jgi:hypothetical protein
VLSLEEVRAILGCVRTPHNRAFLSTVYTCGLRLQEAQHLEISDIDTIAPGAQWDARRAPEGGPTRRSAINQHKMIHVHRSKGAKDRFVPLPESTLQCLRRHWVTHRHPRLLFSALGRDRNRAAQADTPMPKASAASSVRLAGPSLGLAFNANYQATTFMLTFTEPEPPPWPQPICQACGGRLRFHSAVRTPRSTRPLPMSAGPPGSTALPAYG